MKQSLSIFHKVWQRLPAESRRRFFAWATALAVPPIRPVKPVSAHGIIVAGEFSRSSGLGEGARLMVRALRDMNIPCATWDIDRRALEGDVTGPGAPLVMHVNAPMLPYAQLFMPRTLRTGRRIIGYWAWELPVVSETWRHARRHVHEIWAPSRFTADALRPLGRPVRVVEHPVGLAEQKPSDRNRASFGLPEDCVFVLVSFSLASSMVRKSPIETIRAFREAFGDRPDRLLVMKIGHTEHYPEDLAAIHAAIAGAPNIRIETGQLSGPDRLALTACADIILSLHRSEGFGLVVAEAMALGRCVIATDWSATTEFLDETCGLPVAYTLIPAQDPRGIWDMPATKWALPDMASAVHALRTAADDPDLRARLGENATRRIASRLNGASLRDAVRAIGVRT
ncbi:glycosyltransferase family 4 protein [Gluconobacter roseus]|uniref:glycosyltransferase family 4 protein n=1 Tax=Gluconobacter roseus TaxID=586239 RepID=UPI0038D1DA0D